uniref:Dol-P-Glc:Glc(2)Man(9)GlcNAc(2)-PP-Dol alpha-1,2-glucosyltransferase n=1 Tax=Panagrolaimus sp. PS1159 TaxID=55785 RepID=A0AC35F0X0_9BILA
MSGKTVYPIAILLGFIHAVLVKYTYLKVPKPYMDEIFHIDQARAYCNGDYRYWNPMITTPPALYLLTPQFLCFGQERYINSFISPLLFIGLYKLRRRFCYFTNQTSSVLTALSLSLLPVLFDTSVLYYTDMLSTTAITWGFAITNPHISVIFFAISCLTRQTNIVWAGLYVICKLWKGFDKKHPFKSTWNICWNHRAFVILLQCFLIFILLNKGIVLGDKTAHQPVTHFPQLLYMSAFLIFSAAPLFIFNLRQALLNSLRYWYIIPMVIAFSYMSIKCCTMAHPYLLADNRHFTFYLWRRWFMRFEWAAMTTIPIYVISFIFALPYLIDCHGFVITVFGIFATSAVLIPAQLLEFRYFIIPYLLWRISVAETRKFVLLLEILFHLFVSAVALLLFYEKPFRWAHDSADLQRFMW